MPSLLDQRSNIKMIASENFSSLATQCAMANLLTDKYAEGIPHHRFYAGCDNVDSIEDLANPRASELFGAAHAYAQPHSGADANLVAFWAVLRARVELPALVKATGVESAEKLAPADWYKLSLEQWREIRQALGNQRLLGMDLSSGGHLTHGYRLNVSGKMFEAHGYTVDRSTYLLDYDEIERQALDVKPLILLAGFSAYPRNINYARMRAIADRAGALLDGRHGPLRRAGRRQGAQGRLRSDSACPDRDHHHPQDPARTARRAGALQSRAERPRRPRLPAGAGRPAAARDGGQDRGLHRGPAAGIQHVCTAALSKTPGRSREAFVRQGLKVLTGGTENHLLVLDVASTHGITGRQAEDAVRKCGITLNRNPIPFDPNGPWYTSGLRFGAAAVTTLGMGTAEMNEIASIVALVLKHIKPATTRSGAIDKTKYTLDETIRSQAHTRERFAQVLSALSGD